MELLRCRIIITVLWLIMSMCGILWYVLFFLETGKLEGIMAGKYGESELTSWYKFFLGLPIWIEWIMAWAAMTSKLSIYRWINTILGVLFAVILSIGVTRSLDNSSAIIICYVFGIILSLLIVWYGWKLPKKQA